MLLYVIGIMLCVVATFIYFRAEDNDFALFSESAKVAKLKADALEKELAIVKQQLIANQEWKPIQQEQNDKFSNRLQLLEMRVDAVSRSAGMPKTLKIEMDKPIKMEMDKPIRAEITNPHPFKVIYVRGRVKKKEEKK